jgi:methionyl aminopeptidase
MIILKSPNEIDRMRVAGRVTALTIRRILDRLEPGMSTTDLDRIGEESIRAEGCTPSFLGYRGFPGSICTSINDEVVHGIPSPKRILREGDLLSVDVGAVHEGYHGDAAVTVFVGGSPPSEDAARLVKTTEEALHAGIAALHEGGRITDVGHAVQSVAEPAGFSLVREYGGHGVGRSLHEDPIILNYGRPGRGPVVKRGLVVAIEPMVNVGGWETEVQADDWTVVTTDGSLSAHFEHTVAITAEGAEILTVVPDHG